MKARGEHQAILHNMDGTGLSQEAEGRWIKPKWENEPGSIFLSNVFLLYTNDKA